MAKHIINRGRSRDKGIGLVLKIFNNIISNPSDIAKYGDLNFEKIKANLSKCLPALKLLFIAGFIVKDNENEEKRLIWINTKENIKQMRNITEILKLNSTELDTFICLLTDGYSEKDAINAINISKKDD